MRRLGALHSIGGTRPGARSSSTLSGLPRPLADALLSPSREFSPAAIWWWSGEPLTRERLRWQLERFVDGGVWNLVILNLAPSGPLFGSDADDPPFLSEAWWELLDGVCADAASLGARLWLYDQLGFSGADLQARLVQERGEFAGLWLGARADDALEERGFDYLGVEACATLLDRIHGEVERRLGRWLGTTIAGFFQDELPALPTWSRELPAAFAAQHGYELDRSLLWQDGVEAERARRDYHVTRAALAEEAFFKPLNAWHERHGLICGCDQQDPARAGRPVEGVQLYADYPRTHRWFGAPGSDHHGDARIHASLAHLYERPRVWIEAFHSSGWGGTLEETFDWLVPWLRGGATLYNPHAVYASTKGGWWEWAPPATDWRQPYWRHHRVLADAVARLCQTLSLGRHRCDVAILLPTADAQAGALPDGTVAQHAAAAQRTYVELAGDMAWFDQRPGALDRIGRDADVIDDDSLQRAVVDAAGSGGAPSAAGAASAGGASSAGVARLRVAGEAYGAIVLPACTVLEDATAARLAEFAEAGGVVVAVGTAPERGVGVAARGADDADGGADDADGGAGDAGGGADDAPGLARLRAAFDRGRATVVPAGDDAALAAALAVVPAVAESDAPMLVREVDGTLVAFLTAAAPSATRVAVDAPEERGVGFGWLHPRIDFDRSRYAPSARVRVRGEHASALLVSPFDGSARVVAGTPAGDGTSFEVPFDDGPAALLVVPPAAAAGAPAPAATPTAGAREPAATPIANMPAPAATPTATPASGATVALPATWACELVLTLENDWGDLALPAASGAPPLERWALRWRVERDGEDGVRDGWADPAHDDGSAGAGADDAAGAGADSAAGWQAAHATFGPGALWCGPAAPATMPDPSRGAEVGDAGGEPAPDPVDAAAPAWREAIWSRSRGIHKDLLHQHGTLGPKGHVPEEFLDLGPVRAGEAVHVRARVELPPDAGGVLAIGAAAAKRLWIDGAELALDDAGHLAFAACALGTGRHLIDLRLTAEEDLDHLRAHLAVVREEAVERYRRPEWIAAAAAGSHGDATSELACDLSLREKPARAIVQVAAYAPCALRVNGAVVGRQGGFDPYAEQDVPRVRRYDVTGALRAGDNELAVELPAPAPGEPLPAVLVDALVDERVVCSGREWRARVGGEPAEVTTRRAQADDPASLHLTRRPHPLPGAAWLDPDADDGSVLPLPLAVPRDEHGAGAAATPAAADAAAPPPAGAAPPPAAGASLPTTAAPPPAGASPASGRVEWLRFAIPPGTTAIDVRPEGVATLFVDGVAQEGLRLDPAPRARLGALRIATRPGFEGGAALAAPIRFEVGPGEIALGDWEQVGLPEYSGGVRYRSTIDVAGAAPSPTATLDLGELRGTAEVRVNGVACGTRICAPYRFDVGAALRAGANEVEVLVLGTLGPYLDAVSPTHFVFDGQRTTGLCGPVTLHIAGGSND